jgi:CRISPR-associated protein Cmr1
MKEFTVLIKPLTPIWTGDAEGKITTLKETGIIGSLRWWYETLIRGLGWKACDPTKTECKESNHCNACELFGCTGWGRKFRLEASLANSMEELNVGTRKGPHKRKILGFISENPVTLTIIPLRKITGNEWALLNRTLKIIEKYGALGAHCSQGNGVIKILQNSLPGQESGIDIKNFKSKDTYYSNLRDFFFYKFQLEFMRDILELIEEQVFWIHREKKERTENEEFEKWRRSWNDYHFLPVALHVRDSVRPLEQNRNKRHAFFGKMGRGSRVFVSHGYMINNRVVEMRIWGYKDDGIREKIKENLGTELRKHLFCDSSKEYLLKECRLKDEKTGKEVIEELI